MNKPTTTTAVTGLAVAMAAGTAAYMMTHRQSSSTRKIKRTTGKAIRTLGSVLGSVESMMH